MKATLAYQSSNVLGEGPIWHAERQSFFWVDIEAKLLYQMQWPEKHVHSWPMPQRIGMIAQEDENNFIVALQDGLARFDIETSELEWLVDIEKDITTNRPNDGKCDAVGRLWLGTMDINCNKDTGALYCIDKEFSVAEKLSRLTISNGMAWSLDNKTFYFIDSNTYKIDAYSFDLETASIEFIKTAIEVPKKSGMPDGMTIDKEGMLWVAHWDGFAVCRWNPHNGELIDTIDLPVPQVTSCTFGGENSDQLFITTASTGLSKEQLLEYPLSGHVFVAQPGVKGATPNKFRRNQA